MYFSLLHIVLSCVTETTERVVSTYCSRLQDMPNEFDVFWPRISRQVRSDIMNIGMGQIINNKHAQLRKHLTVTSSTPLATTQQPSYMVCFSQRLLTQVEFIFHGHISLRIYSKFWFDLSEHNKKIRRLHLLVLRNCNAVVTQRRMQKMRFKIP